MNYDVQELSIQVARTAHALETNISHIVPVDFIEMVLVQFALDETLPYSSPAREQALMRLENKANKGECKSLIGTDDTSFKAVQFAITEELGTLAQSSAIAIARVENCITNIDKINIKMEQSQLAYTIRSVFTESFKTALNSFSFLMGKHRLSLSPLSINTFAQELRECCSQRDHLADETDDITQQMLAQNTLFIDHVYKAFETAVSCANLTQEEKDVAHARGKEFLATYKRDVEAKLNADIDVAVDVSSESSYTQRLRLKRNVQRNFGKKFVM